MNGALEHAGFDRAGFDRAGFDRAGFDIAALRQRVEPMVDARQRVLPVVAALEPLLPERGLIRGSVVACQGSTAMSVALATVAGASAAGSWIGLVGCASVGLRAARELGVALERLVMIAEPTGPESGYCEPKYDESKYDEMVWANMVSALIDGFDLVVMRARPQLSGRGLRPGTARRLQARAQARGAVLVIVGDQTPFSTDLVITGSGARWTNAGWEGLGEGTGRLQQRRLTLTAHGRRLARQRHLDVWLPGPSGGIDAVDPVVGLGAGEQLYQQTGS